MPRSSHNCKMWPLNKLSLATLRQLSEAASTLRFTVGDASASIAVDYLDETARKIAKNHFSPRKRSFSSQIIRLAGLTILYLAISLLARLNGPPFVKLAIQFSTVKRWSPFAKPLLLLSPLSQRSFASAVRSSS